MLKIGLTGGIGSGKTTVAHIFEVLGIPVYFADDEAKKIMNENEVLKQQIIQHFGTESYTNGRLNRTYLAKVVFADEKKTAQINALIHPITIADANRWMAKQTSPYVVKEAALIFEANVHIHLDAVIGVYAPTELRLQRVMKRDNITEIQVLARMQKQMNDEEKMKRCNYIIHNTEQQLLIPQVIALHAQLLQQAMVK